MTPTGRRAPATKSQAPSRPSTGDATEAPKATDEAVASPEEAGRDAAEEATGAPPPSRGLHPERVWPD